MSKEKRITTHCLDRMTERPTELIKQVIAGSLDAWQAFIQIYSGFIYSLAWRYARGDVDTASELVLVALEGLRKPDRQGREFHRLQKYLESLEVVGGQGRFINWLALVVKNIFRDWYRSSQGRRTMPRKIRGLDSIGQEIYKLAFWQGLSESEIISKLQCERGLEQRQVESSLNRVMKVLKDKKLIFIYRDFMRITPMNGLGSKSFQTDGRLREVIDPRPQVRPDLVMEIIEDRAMAEWIGNLLKQAIESLDDCTRKVLMLHSIRGLSGEVVAKILGLDKRQRVYDELAKAKRKIRVYMEKAGVDREQVQLVIGHVGGWIIKID